MNTPSRPATAGASIGGANHPAWLPGQPAVLAVVLVSYLMILLDVSVVITALPKIQASLQLSTANLSWVQNAYTLAFGGLLLLGARAGDVLGRRRMLVIGLALFTAASLVIGLAPSATWLILARAVQGMGAAVLAPSTLALLSVSFPEGPGRTRALAWYGATAGIGASVGLVLGGVIADALSWRVGFFINLPIGIALILGARRWLTETERHTGALDVAGGLTSAAGMIALVYGIVRSVSSSWSDGLTQACVSSGVALLIAFVVIESRARQPIMPLRLFANAERSGAYAARLLFLGGMVGFWFFGTQLLQGVLGYSPMRAGLAFLPMTLPNFATALLVPRLTGRFGNATVLACGLLLCVVGAGWLSVAGASTPYLSGVALPMILIGIGQGATLSPLTISGVRGVGKADAGAASGVVNVAHQLGGSLGLAVLVVAFHAASGATTDTATLARQINAALQVGTGLLALALLLVVTCILRPERRARAALAIQPG
ncbi:MFS transporter [Pseudoxanthomonas sp.]|uniref:MFS transporter n=1 Tax=Pseudoxanthomonas sp. TaxID=1871049 RepID=UPI002614E08F|nr:MFS transporter [Pseudoxanthomonas sp.]WDS36493.1 MAG: MFS transporter [Pseudoxanthomonas sp.]